MIVFKKTYDVLLHLLSYVLITYAIYSLIILSPKLDNKDAIIVIISVFWAIPFLSIYLKWFIFDTPPKSKVKIIIWVVTITFLTIGIPVGIYIIFNLTEKDILFIMLPTVLWWYVVAFLAMIVMEDDT